MRGEEEALEFLDGACLPVQLKHYIAESGARAADRRYSPPTGAVPLNAFA